MNQTWRRAARLPLVALVLAMVATGCDFDGAYDLPLPGSPVDAENAYTVTAEFEDVLNVVPRSTVRVDDVTVGEVTEVERSGWHASVTMNIRDDVELPDNAIAEVRQSSLLGAKYVALAEPEAAPAQGRLEDGDRLPLSGTGRNPAVEEVLGALSFVLSGGGVGQLGTITTEFNNVMNGRTGRLNHLLGALEQTVATVDDQKGDIINALESLNSLSRTLNREKGVIEQALQDIPPAVRVLSDQHDELIEMLDALRELGDVGTRVIRASRENTLSTLDDLRPVLRRLNEAGQSLAPGLALAVSFPFPKEAANVVKGDFANTSIRLDISLENFLPDGGGGSPLPDVPLPSLSDLQQCLNSGRLGGQTCQKFLNDANLLQGLRQECAKPENQDKAVCRALPAPGDGGGDPNGPSLPDQDLDGLLGLRLSSTLQSGATEQDASRRELLGVSS